MPHHFPDEPVRRAALSRHRRQAGHFRKDRRKPNGQGIEAIADKARRLSAADPAHPPNHFKSIRLNKDLHNTPGGPSGIHEDLLVKYLLGESSLDEHDEVVTWLAADPANQRYLEHFRLIWQGSRHLGNDIRAQDDDEHTEAAWQKFRQRIHKP